MEKIDFKNRKFKFWFYHVTHSEALIRSPQNEKYNKNIDIYFAGITYIEVPSVMQDLNINLGTHEDAEYLSNKLGMNIPRENITVLNCDNRKFYIVSSVIKIMENDLSALELPFFTFIKNK